jgi:hypothetical protein
MISDEFVIQPAHNASQKPMDAIAAIQALYIQAWENRKRETRTNNREQYLRTCNAVNAANHAGSAAALSRKSARRKMGMKHHKKKPPENKHQSRPLLGPELNSPLFIHPCCAVDQRTPCQKNPQNRCYENVPVSSVVINQSTHE